MDVTLNPETPHPLCKESLSSAPAANWLAVAQTRNQPYLGKLCAWWSQAVWFYQRPAWGWAPANTRMPKQPAIEIKFRNWPGKLQSQGGRSSKKLFSGSRKFSPLTRREVASELWKPNHNGDESRKVPGGRRKQKPTFYLRKTVKLIRFILNALFTLPSIHPYFPSFLLFRQQDQGAPWSTSRCQHSGS